MRLITEPEFWLMLPVDKVAFVIYLLAGVAALWGVFVLLAARGKKRGWLMMAGALALLISAITAFYHNLMYFITVMMLPWGAVLGEDNYLIKAVSNLMFPLFVSLAVAIPLLLFSVWLLMQAKRKPVA